MRFMYLYHFEENCDIKLQIKLSTSNIFDDGWQREDDDVEDDML